LGIKRVAITSSFAAVTNFSKGGPWRDYTYTSVSVTLFFPLLPFVLSPSIPLPRNPTFNPLFGEYTSTVDIVIEVELEPKEISISMKHKQANV